MDEEESTSFKNLRNIWLQRDKPAGPKVQESSDHTLNNAGKGHGLFARLKQVQSSGQTLPVKSSRDAEEVQSSESQNDQQCNNSVPPTSEEWVPEDALPSKQSTSSDEESEPEEDLTAQTKAISGDHANETSENESPNLALKTKTNTNASASDTPQSSPSVGTSRMPTKATAAGEACPSTTTSIQAQKGTEKKMQELASETVDTPQSSPSVGTSRLPTEAAAAGEACTSTAPSIQAQKGTEKKMQELASETVDEFVSPKKQAADSHITSSPPAVDRRTERIGQEGSEEQHLAQIPDIIDADVSESISSSSSEGDLTPRFEEDASQEGTPSTLDRTSHLSLSDEDSDDFTQEAMQAVSCIEEAMQAVPSRQEFPHERDTKIAIVDPVPPGERFDPKGREPEHQQRMAPSAATTKRENAIDWEVVSFIQSGGDTHLSDVELANQKPANHAADTIDGSQHRQIIGGLHQQISLLSTELDRLKTDKEIEKLCALPPVDSSRLIAEMETQLDDKNRRLGILEQENAQYKRNQMIQAVELQELSDHVQGLEKAKSSLEQHVFPPLQQIQCIMESVCEDGAEDNLSVAQRAQDALDRAEQEMATLRKGEHRRQQLEIMLDHAKLKISLLEGQTPGSKSPLAAGLDSRMHRAMQRGGQDSVTICDLQRQLDASQKVLDASRAEVVELQARMRELSRDSIARISVAVQVSTQQGPPPPPRLSSNATAAANTKGAAASEDWQATEQRSSKDAETLSSTGEPEAGEREGAATAHARAEDMARIMKEMEEIQSLAGQGQDVLRVMEECLVHLDPLVSVLDQRSDLAYVLRAIASRTQTLLTSSASRAPAKQQQQRESRERTPVASSREEQLVSKVKELERNERFLKEEMELASTALAKATAQNNASTIELGILRSQLEGVTSRRGGGDGARANEDESALHTKVLQLERERDQLIQCLDDLHRTIPASQSNHDNGVGLESAATAELLQTLLAEKQDLEAAVMEARHVADVTQVDLKEARMELLRRERENEELDRALTVSRTKIAELHEEICIKRKEISNLSGNVSKLSAALCLNSEATNTDLQLFQQSSPASATSDSEVQELQRELSSAQDEMSFARDEIGSLQARLEEQDSQLALKNQKLVEESQALAAESQGLQKELSNAREEIEALHEKVAEQDKQGLQKELSSAREEIKALHEKVAEQDKQLQLKKQKLAVLAEYKMQMVKGSADLCIKET